MTYTLKRNGPGDFLLLGLILSSVWFLHDLYEKAVGT